jgi:hypothetical protein
MQCARLRLPLDYHDDTLLSPYIALPVIRLSSRSSSRSRTLIMGPVGPGQSSIRTSLAMTFSSALPWLDEINDKYDILAFEPRGVGFAAPHAGCFESVWPGRSWDGVVDTASGVIHGGDADEDGEAYAEGTSDLGLRTRLAAVRACGALCAEKALRADYNEDAGTAINCGDSEAISNVTLSEFTSYLRALEGQSTVGALVQGERKLRCLGWPAALHPAYRFSGPFGADALEKGILFVGNTLDPVTPVGNAHLMAGLFKGSVCWPSELSTRRLRTRTVVIDHGTVALSLRNINCPFWCCPSCARQTSLPCWACRGTRLPSDSTSSVVCTASAQVVHLPVLRRSYGPTWCYGPDGRGGNDTPAI